MAKSCAEKDGKAVRCLGPGQVICPPWQINFLHWAAANQPDGQITSDYQK